MKGANDEISLSNLQDVTQSQEVRTESPGRAQSANHDLRGSQYRPSSHTETKSDQFQESGDMPGNFPTTADLAQSLLQTEPLSERKKLEAALAQRDILDNAFDDIGDEADSLGVGNPLVLPIVTKILKSFKDRFQLKAKNVTLELDLDLDIPSEPSPGKCTTDTSEVVTIRLSVGSVDLHEIGNIGPKLDLHSDAKSKPFDAPVPGLRRISIDNVQVMLVSDASVFTNISRYFTPSSPAVTNVSSQRRSNGQYIDSTSQATSTASSATHAPPGLVRTQNLDQAAHLTSEPIDSPTASDVDRNSDDGYDDTGEALAPTSSSSLGESRYQDSLLAESLHSKWEDSEPGGRSSYQRDRPSMPLATTAHEYIEANLRKDPKRHEKRLQRDQIDLKRSQLDLGKESSRFSYSAHDSISSQLASLCPPNDVVLGGDVSEDRQSDSSCILENSQSSLNSSNDEDDTASVPPDDLTQSKIYSHEEAESLYMSAISYAPSENSGDDESPLCTSQASHPKDEQPNRNILPRRENMQASTFDTRLKLSQPSAATKELGVLPPSRRDGDLYLGEAKPNSPTSSSSSHSSPTTIMSRSMPTSQVIQSGDSLSQVSRYSSTRSETSLIITKRIISIDSIMLKIPESANDINILGEAEGSEKPADQLLSVEIANVEILGDVSLTKLTILIIQQHLGIFQFNSNDDNPHDKDGGTSGPSFAHLKLTVSKLSWKFLDLVKGFSSPNARMQEVVWPGPFPVSAEVLLKASIDDLGISFFKNGSVKKTMISIGKFSFGYVSEKILSFNSALKMRESTRDILAPVDKDLILTITQTSGSSSIEITTLPLQITLDLRRLDDTFSWFGGFSGILGLGSSMVSTVTTVSAKPVPPKSATHSRGVHFEVPGTETSSQRDKPPEQKIYARIGGFVMVLQGANATLRLESSAIKLVSQAEVIGLQIDKMKLTGPYLRHDVDQASVTANLRNIRLEYLPTPKEIDLDRLLELLSPSKDSYERDDDILLDTLLLQRRQGGVVRLIVESLESSIPNIEHLRLLPELTEELKKLSTVARYLPDDDRPGILTLAKIRDFKCNLTVDDNSGVFSLGFKNLEVAHVTLPSLTALGIDFIEIHRNNTEELLGQTLSYAEGQQRRSPVIMARFLGNEMEPVIKVKIQNLRAEYHVSTIMAFMGLSGDSTTEDMISGMVSSIATITTSPQNLERIQPKLSSRSSEIEKFSSSSKLMRLDISIRDSIIGLNPYKSLAKGLIVLTDARLSGTLPKKDEADATFEIKKASLMIIDDHKNVISERKPVGSAHHDNQNTQLQCLLDKGFVSVSYISSAKVTLKLFKMNSDGSRCIDVELRDDLFVLESCADSTQTLTTILNGLRPPMPPSTEVKYRTEVVTVEDMLASFTGDAFSAPHADEKMDYTAPLDLDEGDMVNDEVPQSLEYVSTFYNPEPENFRESLANSMLENDLESLANPPATREIGDKVMLESFQEQYQVAPGGSTLDFRENHFGDSSTVGGTAHRWDTKQNTYCLTSELKISGSPLRLRVRDVHIIWNLFDGYDWQHTRDIIDKAVVKVETKATERFSRPARGKSREAEEEEESVIGDFLFNSIYIGIPTNHDPKELARQVNRNLDDLASESESQATYSTSNSPNRQDQILRSRIKRLRLNRSKYHKMTFELKGVSADIIVYQPDMGETQSSIDIRVHDLEIFDHVPTSTWKKFATYMHDAGERESGTSMVHIEILNVKPVANLAASELILKVS